MIDYSKAIAENTERFAAAIEATDPDARVPSCPDWSAADLCYHLYEVQVFWARVAEERRDGPEGIDEPPRPSYADLPGAVRGSVERMLAAIADLPDNEEYWAWVGPRTKAWYLRRQAHEALIHRVDAELAAGVGSDLDGYLAADGVQELIDNYLAISQPWASFEPQQRIKLVRTDGPDVWYLAKGRFHGTSTVTGNTYDMVTIAGVDAGQADVTIRGTAAAIDLWLWGRGPIDALEIRGDLSLAEFLREDLAETTK